jgi:hypothetical protein
MFSREIGPRLTVDPVTVGLPIMSDPSPGPTRPKPGPATWGISVTRPEDMLVLQVDFSNSLKVDPTGKLLILSSTPGVATITLSFPAQHIVEHSPDKGNEATDALPCNYRVAGGSSITFTLPPGFQKCDYTLAAILELCAGVPSTPSINMPAQLVLWPAGLPPGTLPAGAFAYAALPAGSASTARTELWHTRLSPASGATSLPTLVASPRCSCPSSGHP